MSVLKPLLPIESNPDFVRAFSNEVARNAGKVCTVCGLCQTGHAPESKWLGYAPHDWTPRAATATEIEQARELTRVAYRNRRGVNYA